ncbi:MAG: hypothetical protein QXU75_09725 [Candidatus Methanomethylicaceae archaeon]
MSKERLSVEELQRLVDLLRHPKRKKATLQAAAASDALPIEVGLELDPIEEYIYRLRLDERHSIVVETDDPDWQDRVIHCVFRVEGERQSVYLLTSGQPTVDGFYQALGFLPSDFHRKLIKLAVNLADITFAVPVPFTADPKAFQISWQNALCKPSLQSVRDWFERNRDKFTPKTAERWEAVMSQMTEK